MFNSQNLGALIVKKDAEVKSWEEQPYSIQNMAIDEEYGFGILNEGQAIACARYIKVRPNEFVMPARTVFNLSEAGNTYEDVDSVQVTGAVVPQNSRKYLGFLPLSAAPSLDRNLRFTRRGAW
jgi:hypothetical protein